MTKIGKFIQTETTEKLIIIQPTISSKLKRGRIKI